MCGCVGMWEGMETFGKDFPAERNTLENVCAGEAAGPEAPGAQRGGGQDRTRPRHRRPGLSAGGREVGRELGAGQGTTLTEDAESGNQRGGQGRVV